VIISPWVKRQWALTFHPLARHSRYHHSDIPNLEKGRTMTAVFAGTEEVASATEPLGAARSFYVVVKNYAVDLTRKDFGLKHGKWGKRGDGKGESVPPEKISRGTKDYWYSESDGLATGTEGTCVYGSERGNLEFWWNNPYVGSDGFNVNYDHNELDVSWPQPAHNDAYVEVTINIKI
jgi:hypothetical protein